MFCRLSIKDIRANNHHQDQTSVQDPASPKVSCIGQVKRNNRVIGHPANAYSAVSTNHHHHHHKFTKQQRVLSSKTILRTMTNDGARSAVRSCRMNEETWERSHSRMKLKTDGRVEDCLKVIDIGYLDPPLPVVQREAPPLGVRDDEVNIWKRRCNGVALKHLQIQ
ncbi:hypothetical protein F511_03321 [Dorcoceras hygrometricum]|uniref:Uncharacterized protein n=1 Tax=Dorcoceras hygrometricum TaxID=472368 RepID=A0A2Z7BG08_9LAMI|nr:hypothetical protein F511_03321 [Dorcoceras hygrometricum]